MLSRMFMYSGRLISTVGSESIQNKYFNKYHIGEGFYNQHSKILKDLKYLTRKVNNITVHVEKDTFDLLAEAFDLSATEVMQLVKYPVLRNCSKDEIYRSVDYLIENNVNGQFLLLAPWLLWQSSDDLTNRRMLMNKLNLFEKDTHGIGFLFFPKELIYAYKFLFEKEKHKFGSRRNRIYYICEELNLPVEKFTLRAVLTWPVFHRSKKKLDEVIVLLKEYKIMPQSILDDLYIFMQNPEFTRERLKILSQVSSVPSKPWIGRCTSSDFVKHYLHARSNSDKMLLKMHDNIYHYVASEIDYDIEKVKTAFSKYLKGGVSSQKIIRNLFALKSWGFSSEQIRNNLTILRCTTAVIDNRMQRLKEILVEAGDVIPIYLIGSTKSFDNYFLKCKIESDVKQKFQNNEKGVCKATLTDEELLQCLSTQLDLSIENLNQNLASMSRKPSPNKILRNLQLLKEFKFSNDQISSGLNALSASTDVIKRRMKLLTEKGIKPNNIRLSYFTRSEKEFNHILSTYKSTEV